MKKIYNFIRRNEKKIFTLLMIFIAVSTMINVTYAADNPKLITGTVNLFKAVTSWLLLIIPVGAGAYAGWHAFQKSMTDDETVIAQKNRLIKNTIIGAAIATTADGLITAILNFYK